MVESRASISTSDRTSAVVGSSSANGRKIRTLGAGTTAPIYDRIGRGYAAQRIPEPSWIAQIDAALGDAGSVLNVGAGSGNYEPVDRAVIALEPSSAMLAQRSSPHPAVQGAAELLPFRDATFDAAMATFTVHHWTAKTSGLRELRRVAERQVLVVFEPLVTHDFWLLDYFPEVLAAPTETQAPTPADIGAILDLVDVQTLWIPADCTDGVAAAYWRRPEAYLDPAVQQSTSVLALLPDDALARGTARLASDLDDGTWLETHAQLLDQEAADYGYRLVIAES